MACKCGSKRILSVSAKCSDRFDCIIDGKEYEGYVPDDIGIGFGSYIKFEYCLDCGQIQGEFPLPTTKIESKENEDI